jgi:hypothetical protein
VIVGVRRQRSGDDDVLSRFERQAAGEDAGAGTGPALPASRGRGSSPSRRGACAGGAGPYGSRRPAGGARSSRRAAICSAERTRTRAAASSMARGSPSRRAQICTTARALAAVRVKPGRAAAARSTNRRTASYDSTSTGGERGHRGVAGLPSGSSGTVSGGTVHKSSPSTPKADRLVARIWSRGQARNTGCRRGRRRPARGARSCQDEQQPARAQELDQDVRKGAAQRLAHSRAVSDGPGTSDVSATGRARSGGTVRELHRPRLSRRPCAYRLRARRGRARRVLPAPPARSRSAGESRVRSWRTSSTSRSRPTKLLSGTGKAGGRPPAGVGVPPVIPAGGRSDGVAPAGGPRQRVAPTGGPASGVAPTGVRMPAGLSSGRPPSAPRASSMASPAPRRSGSGRRDAWPGSGRSPAVAAREGIAGGAVASSRAAVARPGPSTPERASAR